MEPKTVIPQVTCIDCGKQITTKIAMKTVQMGVHRCEECQRTYNDNLYLDNGSEAIVKENADRDTMSDISTHEENEAALDKLLED